MRLALVGSAVHLPGVGAESARYNLATGFLEAYVQSKLDRVHVSRLELPITLDRPEFAEDAIDRILASDPEVIGISSYTWDVDAFFAIIPELRRRAPGVRLVLGGPSATFDAPNLMAQLPQLDVAVRGEGEETLVELLNGGFDRLEQVPGLMYRDGDAIRETAARPPVPDMAQLKSPYLAGVLNPPRNNLMLECSRGCLFRCKYCAWKNFLGGVRYTPHETTRAEIRWAIERGYNHAFILDSAINFDTQRLTSLMSLLRETVPNQSMRFSYFLSHLHVNEQQIRALSGVATHEIYIGLESVRDEALKTVGRPPLDKARFESVLDQVSAVGPATVSVILGIPGDTFAGFRETIDYLADLAHKGGRQRIRNVRVFWMIIAPGSSLATQKEELGIITAPKGVPYLYRCNTFTEAHMRLAFQFLANHPARNLFLWDDADPAGHFDQLPSLTPATQQTNEESRMPAMGPVHLDLQELGRLLPMIRPGVRTASGWEVRQLSVREGWPSICMERGNQRMEIQVRKRSAGNPAFVNTRLFALSWMGTLGGDSLSADGSVQQLMMGLAKEIQKREGRT